MNQRPQCSNIAVANSANYCDAGTLLIETSVSWVQFSQFSQGYLVVPSEREKEKDKMKMNSW